MTIGERIATRRKALNMTQEELAVKLGYKSKSTINKIELGINELRQTKVAEFAMALNCEPSYLMGWIEEESDGEEPQGLSDMELELVLMLRKLPEERQAWLMNVLRAALSDVPSGEDYGKK